MFLDDRKQSIFVRGHTWQFKSHALQWYSKALLARKYQPCYIVDFTTSQGRLALSAHWLLRELYTVITEMKWISEIWLWTLDR